MKKILTTVGISLFTNSDVQDEQSYESLKEKPHKDWQSNLGYIDRLKPKVQINDVNASAELSSLIRIIQEVNEDVEIFLISTDTILSRLSCEIHEEQAQAILQRRLSQSIEFHFNPNVDVISELQVKSKEKFEKEGLVNLLNRIENIAQGYWENVLFNITGGYKALIPYMTILAQVHGCKSYYTFRDSDTNQTKFELLKIPNLPLSINESLFEKYWENFEKLESERAQESKTFNHSFLKEAESCLEIAGNLVDLNPLGLFLWRKYKQDFFIFYAPDDTYAEIQKQSNINRILKEKNFPNESKTEKKGEHLVHDDGNNSNRIFYFKEENKIYIYKTFEDHDKYESFLNNNPNLNKEKIKEISKPRKLKR